MHPLVTTGVNTGDGGMLSMLMHTKQQANIAWVAPHRDGLVLTTGT